MNVIQCRIKSSLAARIVKAYDVAYKEYSLHPDPRFMALALAQACDQVNMEIAEGLAPDTSCVCTTLQSQTEFHPCANCLEPVLCHTLTLDQDEQRVCPECLQDPPASKDRLRAEEVIEQSLAVNFRRELRRLGRDPDDKVHVELFKKALAELVATLPDQSEGAAFSDAYANDEIVKISSEVQTKLSRARHPDIASVDAARPRFHAAKSGMLGHAPGNLVVTRDFINRLKGIHVPGVLALVGKWLQMSDQERASYVHEFVSRLEDMHIVRCKIPYYVAAKGTEAMIRERYKREMAEVRAGRPIPGEDGPWRANSERWTQASIPIARYEEEDSYIWRKVRRDAFIKIGSQYQKIFPDVKLQYAKDGSIYIGFNACTKSTPKGVMEVGYGFNGIAVLCRERLDRTRFYCNKRSKTVNTVYDYYAEMIRSCYFDHACILGDCRETDTHFLHLPKVLRFKHFLRLSVGHLHHKEQMILRWSGEPSDISEREDDAGVPNNMLMETWAENSSKFEYDEDFYAIMRQAAQRASAPSWLYKPDGDLPKNADSALAQVTSVDISSELALGPTIDLLKLGEDDDEKNVDNSAAATAAATAAAAAAAAQGGETSGDSRPPLAGADTEPATEIRNHDYENLEVEIANLAVKGDRAYGTVMVVGTLIGYATQAGQFITVDGEVLGRWDANGTVYRTTNLLLPEIGQYKGSTEVKRALYDGQVDNLVDNNHIFYTYVLVDTSERVGFATTANTFMANDHSILGTFDADLRRVYDAKGEFIGQFDEFMDVLWIEQGADDGSASDDQQDDDIITGEQVDPTRIIGKIPRPDRVPDQVPSNHGLYNFTVRDPPADPAFAQFTDENRGRFVTQAGTVEGGWYQSGDIFVISGQNKHETLAHVSWDEQKQTWVALLTDKTP
jgi:hypothetical protein